MMHYDFKTFVNLIRTFSQCNIQPFRPNCIGDVMVSMIASSAVDRSFEPRSSQINDYEIGMCCFSTKNAELRRKSKDLLAQN